MSRFLAIVSTAAAAAFWIASACADEKPGRMDPIPPRCSRSSIRIKMAF